MYGSALPSTEAGNVVIQTINSSRQREVGSFRLFGASFGTGLIHAANGTDHRSPQGVGVDILVGNSYHVTAHCIRRCSVLAAIVGGSLTIEEWKEVSFR